MPPCQPCNPPSRQARWTPKITPTFLRALGLAAGLLGSSSALAHDIALEPPSSPSSVRVMVHGGYSALHDEAARSFRIGAGGAALSGAVIFDLMEVMSFSASLGTIFLDNHDLTPANDGENGKTGDESLNIFVGSLAAGLRSPTVRFTDKHHEGGYPAAWMSMRYGHGWHNTAHALELCGDCDAQDIAQADGSFVEATLTVGRLGGVVGVLADIGYRRFLDGGLSRYAATLGVGVSW